jgi:hypothetical protein
MLTLGKDAITHLVERQKTALAVVDEHQGR